MNEQMEILIDNVDRKIIDIRECLYSKDYTDAHEYVLEARLELYKLHRCLDGK